MTLTYLIKGPVRLGRPLFIHLYMAKTRYLSSRLGKAFLSCFSETRKKTLWFSDFAFSLDLFFTTFSIYYFFLRSIQIMLTGGTVPLWYNNETIMSWAKENFDLICLLVGVFGVLISIVTLIYEKKRRETTERSKFQLSIRPKLIEGRWELMPEWVIFR